MGEINQALAALRQEVAALRAQIDATDDWASSVFLALQTLLPFLLRGHAQAAQVRDLLQGQERLYEDLQAHPHKAGDVHGHAHQLEAAAMLYRDLALMGVWPGMAPDAQTQQVLARAGWKAPWPS